MALASEEQNLQQIRTLVAVTELIPVTLVHHAAVKKETEYKSLKNVQLPVTNAT